MTTPLNKDFNGHSITNESQNVPDGTAINLEHDTFYGEDDFQIWTEPGQQGTRIGDSDYTLAGEDPVLTDRAGRTIYTNVSIDNTSYQNTDLYFNYLTIGDYVEAEDIDNPKVIHNWGGLV
jgi:hypothetical protein